MKQYNLYFILIIMMFIHLFILTISNYNLKQEIKLQDKLLIFSDDMINNLTKQLHDANIEVKEYIYVDNEKF